VSCTERECRRGAEGLSGQSSIVPISTFLKGELRPKKEPPQRAYKNNAGHSHRVRVASMSTSYAEKLLSKYRGVLSPKLITSLILLKKS
jgi:hypothetical protein